MNRKKQVSVLSKEIDAVKSDATMSSAISSASYCQQFKQLQIKTSSCSTYNNSSIPRVAPEISAKDLILTVINELPGKEGTKEQILNYAVLMCPQANKDSNPSFYKTLEQALSKRLSVKPTMIHLIASEQYCNEILSQLKPMDFKEKVVECLNSTETKCADMESIK